MRYYKGTALRFNVISPGRIFDPQPASFSERYKQYAQHKGMLAPADVAGALVFLISDLSSYVNGRTSSLTMGGHGEPFLVQNRDCRLGQAGHRQIEEVD